MSTEEKIQKLQMMEQTLTNLLMQRQQFQSQLLEVQSALSELDDTEKVYRIIGNIMVDSTKDGVKKELESKKEVIELRIKNLEKQENKIKEKSKEIQSEVMKDIGDKNGAK